MSRFDKLFAECITIRRAHFSQNAVSSFIVALIALACVFGPSLITVILSIPAALFGALLLHAARKTLSSTYSAKCSRLAEIETEAESIKKRVTDIYSRYPRRKHAERFKDAYELRGLARPQLEEALAVGMHHEQREIFVTCFMRSGVAQRVTATIGSPRRCSNSDNIANWKDHYERLDCDEILQYHNHSVITNSTEPSPQDFHSARLLANVLGPLAPRCHSLLLYWNQALEWRLIEYDAQGTYRIIREFDANVA